MNFFAFSHNFHPVLESYVLELKNVLRNNMASWQLPIFSGKNSHQFLINQVNSFYDILKFASNLFPSE